MGHIFISSKSIRRKGQVKIQNDSMIFHCIIYSPKTVAGNYIAVNTFHYFHRMYSNSVAITPQTSTSLNPTSYKMYHRSVFSLFCLFSFADVSLYVQKSSDAEWTAGFKAIIAIFIRRMFWQILISCYYSLEIFYHRTKFFFYDEFLLIKLSIPSDNETRYSFTRST